MTTKLNTRETQQPIREAYHIIKREGQSNRWHRIGAEFPHEDGLGSNLYIDSLPLNFDGCIVMRQRSPKPDNGEPETVE